MAENSYLGFLSDPSAMASDMFASLNGQDEGGFLSSLQPSLITPAAASSYQALDSESLMTLGEPAPPSKPSANPPGAPTLSYTQLGLSTPYHSLNASFPPPHQPPHAPHRYPAGYYPPGVPPGAGGPPAGYPAANPPQRFGHDPYRHPQFSAYGAAGSGGGPTPPSSWPASAVGLPGQNAYLSPQNAPMRPPYGTHQGYPDGQSPFVNHGQPQFGGGNAAGAATQGFQGMRMMPGYAGGMPPGSGPGQQAFPSSMASPFPGYAGQQPAQGMPQNRLPGMPYSMQAQMANRFPPSHGQPGSMQPPAPRSRRSASPASWRRPRASRGPRTWPA
ncbi:proline-rich proteoglycan 2-like [Paramacrobiotus metropolitanus]|uniref:proline-rich proteoglycan 2-like n=1 Tax=Paramacrobiotus metropolitanus TaxID=2943436 RepID=UPI0024456421|nr:proline-rich proteoglycan 2-like [Paramacrobiotus metropolitanus]XP_055356652.1 proline-rich proteoglycan 2-like [Paramacrobiotus metropolitanus]